jgi:hypothetical protein
VVGFGFEYTAKPENTVNARERAIAAKSKGFRAIFPFFAVFCILSAIYVDLNRIVQVTQEAYRSMIL